VLDGDGNLAIAKFPKENDEYSIERWEAIAFVLAARAGLETPSTELIEVAGKPVLLSRRFDRCRERRIAYLSALSMLGLADGDRASYPELVDVLAEHGSRPTRDIAELYRRMTFNVLISNVDDHLRNHGFLRKSAHGWTLAPAFDLNPVPIDLRPHILTTNITLDEAACDIDLVLSSAEYFGLAANHARAIVAEVAAATATWRDVASEMGANRQEIDRLRSAFEHDRLDKAVIR
jgi:serine/threonine-protein kinase HipA